MIPMLRAYVSNSTIVWAALFVASFFFVGGVFNYGSEGDARWLFFCAAAQGMWLGAIANDMRHFACQLRLPKVPMRTLSTVIFLLCVPCLVILASGLVSPPLLSVVLPYFASALVICLLVNWVSLSYVLISIYTLFVISVVADDSVIPWRGILEHSLTGLICLILSVLALVLLRHRMDKPIREGAYVPLNSRVNKLAVVANQGLYGLSVASCLRSGLLIGAAFVGIAAFFEGQKKIIETIMIFAIIIQPLGYLKQIMLRVQTIWLSGSVANRAELAGLILTRTLLLGLLLPGMLIIINWLASQAQLNTIPNLAYLVVVAYIFSAVSLLVVVHFWEYFSSKTQSLSFTICGYIAATILVVVNPPILPLLVVSIGIAIGALFFAHRKLSQLPLLDS